MDRKVLITEGARGRARMDFSIHVWMRKSLKYLASWWTKWRDRGDAICLFFE